jgi:hypothetical protein
VHAKQHYGKAGIVNSLSALLVGTHKEVGQEEDGNYGKERKLLAHI